jgi:hypothetical protein
MKKNVKIWFRVEVFFARVRVPLKLLLRPP